MVSREGAYVAPKDFIAFYRAVRAAIDAVGPDFCVSQRGKGWPLLYGHSVMYMVSHATCYTPISIWWNGFPA
jgi:hypothetical protein